MDENYANFKEKLQKYDEIKDALKYGYGIRILRQDIFEMFVSFVISANNNIPRIKNSIKYLREHAGKNMGSFHAFPTLTELSQKDVEFTDEMLEKLKPTEQDLKMLNETNALYLDIFNN